MLRRVLALLAGLSLCLASAKADYSGQFYPTWTSFTPTISCATGSLTAYTATGAYSTYGKVTQINETLTITTVGTCSGAVNVSLPNTTAGPAVLTCREIAVVGTTWVEVALASGYTTGTLVSYANSSTLANGYTFVCGGSYQNQ